MPEKLQPQPLDSEEIKKAILFKIEESLNKSCHLYNCSYAAFKGTIEVRLVLIDLAREDQPDNHVVTLQQGEVPANATVTEKISINLSPEPPNQTRIDTEQPVPVKVVEDGKTTIRKVKYQARKSKSSAKAAAKK